MSYNTMAKKGPPPSFFLSRYLDPLFNPIPLTGWRRRRGGGEGEEVVTDLINRLYGKKEGREKKGSICGMNIWECTRSVLLLLHIPPQKIYILRIFFLLHRSIGLRIVARKNILAHPVFPPSLPQGKKEEVKK